MDVCGAYWLLIIVHCLASYWQIGTIFSCWNKPTAGFILERVNQHQEGRNVLCFACDKLHPSTRWDIRDSLSVNNRDIASPFDPNDPNNISDPSDLNLSMLDECGVIIDTCNETSMVKNVMNAAKTNASNRGSDFADIIVVLQSDCHSHM